MAIGILNCSILAMGNQLGTLIDAHSPPGIHGRFFGVVMTAAAFSVFLLHVPTVFHNIRLYFRDTGAVAATPAFPIKRSHAQAQSAKAASGLFSSSFLLPAYADEGR